MKKKLLAGIGLVIGSVLFSRLGDPLVTILDFVIGGIIPGTNLSLGFVPSLLFLGSLVYVMKRWLGRIRLQMLGRRARQIKTEQAQQEFEGSYTTEFDRSKRSVIAARGSKSLV